MSFGDFAFVILCYTLFKVIIAWHILFIRIRLPLQVVMSCRIAFRQEIFLSREIEDEIHLKRNEENYSEIDSSFIEGR